MTRVHALLSWWDESPLWLTAAIVSAAPYIDHVIACDGRYHLYPGDRTQSRVDQAQAIVETCQTLNLGLTLHRPQHAWADNECGKRNHMFRLAELEAQPNIDWLFVIDADIIVDRGITNLRQLLAHTDRDAAEITVLERGDPYRNPARLQHETTTPLNPDIEYPIRAFFRAIPGLTCGPEHWHYKAPDGRQLWGHANDRSQPALGLQEFRIEHRTHHRPMQRHQDAQTYYRARDAAGVETVPA